MSERLDSFTEVHEQALADMGENSGRITDLDTLYDWKSTLTAVRRSILTHNNEDADWIDHEFNRVDGRATRRSLDPKLERPLYNEELEKTELTKWVRKASLEDVRTLLEWNYVRRNELIDAIVRDSPKLLTKILDKTEHLVDINYFPKRAVEIMEKTTFNTLVDGVDGIELGAGEAYGYYVGERDTISLSNLYVDKHNLRGVGMTMSRVALHEYIHAAGNGRGFDPAESKSWTPFDEAFVEHCVTVAYDEPPLIHTARPSSRNELEFDRSFYHPERELLGSIMDAVRIGGDELADIYFRAADDEVGMIRREKLVQKIGQTFGSANKFFRYTEHYDMAKSKRKRQLTHNAIASIAKRY